VNEWVLTFRLVILLSALFRSKVGPRLLNTALYKNAKWINITNCLTHAGRFRYIFQTSSCYRWQTVRPTLVHVVFTTLRTIWRPRWRRSLRAIWFILGMGKLEWLGYKLVKVAWWSTQCFGTIHQRSKCCANALRRAAKKREGHSIGCLIYRQILTVSYKKVWKSTSGQSNLPKAASNPPHCRGIGALV